MKRRRCYILHLIIYPFIPIVLGLSTIIEAPILKWALVILTALIGVLFVGMDTYCPHCHHFGLYPRAHWNNSGYCTCCGELVEWKEYADDAET